MNFHKACCVIIVMPVHGQHDSIADDLDDATIYLQNAQSHLTHRVATHSITQARAARQPIQSSDAPHYSQQHNKRPPAHSETRTHDLHLWVVLCARIELTILRAIQRRRRCRRLRRRRRLRNSACVHTGRRSKLNWSAARRDAVAFTALRTTSTMTMLSRAV